VSNTDWRSLNKSKLTSLAQATINSVAMGVEFESEFLSDLIAERHYYCRVAGLRPTMFRKLPDRPPYTFQGFFDGLAWRGVSWRKSIEGFSFRKDMRRALRDLIEADVSLFKRIMRTCPCGEPATEVDHVDPEFDVMAEEALSLLSASDERALLLSHDWLAEEVWGFPTDHAVAVRLVELHKHAKLAAVCHGCHVKNARIRKGKA